MKVMPPISSQPSADQVHRAAEALRTGKLVGLPTETIYGVAASLAQISGINALKSAVRIQGHPAWVIHVTTVDGLSQYISHFPPLAKRLVRRLWPGPVAIQLPVDQADMERLWRVMGRPTTDEALVDGCLTFRCTEIEITRHIMDTTGDPVTVVGAPGNPRVESVDDLPEFLQNQLSVAIPGPLPRYKTLSTLVRIRGNQVDILREGAVAERVIRRLEDLVIVFVCSGNTCRSPMAAGLAGQILAEKLHIPVDELASRHILIRSAGVYATGGMHPTAEAISVVSEMGVDIRKHRSAPLTDDLLRRADMIYTMTRAHRDEIVARAALSAEKTFTLDPDGDIDDPIGRGEEVYRRTAQRLEKLIRNRLAELEL